MDQFTEEGEAVAPPVKFGTDGIRGEVGEAITAEVAESFGAATAEAIGAGIVVIGRDTRESGTALSDAAAEGAARAGAVVIDAGVLPTPGVAFLARQINAAGMVVTASHNPHTDNGLKAFMPTGSKPDEATTRQIEHLINFSGDRTMPEHHGEIVRHAAEGFREAYEGYLVHSVDPDLFEGQRVVIDAAHGAAYEVAEHVANQLGAETISVAASPNGRNINEGCGATEPGFAAQRVVDVGADFGITLDGDADRVMLISETGRVIDGDRIMLINALAAKQQGGLTNNTVVGTIMSNMGTEVAFKEHSIEFVRAEVGDTEVAREMQKRGAVIGGEQSGHIILAKHAQTGDGILAALQTMQSLRELGMTLDEAADLIQDYPQVLLKAKVPAAHKSHIANAAEVQMGKEGFAQQLAVQGVRGRVLIRPSGTEPAVRVMTEVEPGHDELARTAAAGLLQIVANVAKAREGDV
jgi:phosphoglucosamine mutase